MILRIRAYACTLPEHVSCMHKVFALNVPCDEVGEREDLQAGLGLRALARANRDLLGVSC